MAETPATLIGVDCDPSCKWRGMVEGLKAARVVELGAVPREPYDGNPDDVRPTREGYRLQEEISQEYTGLLILEAAGRTCKLACDIEKIVDTSGDRQFGSHVQVAINNLKGDS